MFSKIITTAAIMATAASALTQKLWLGATDCSGDAVYGATYEVSEP